MCAGQIDQLGIPAFEGQRADVALDCNAGIITDPLFEAGQSIE
jgi:hypothetical protein